MDLINTQSLKLVCDSCRHNFPESIGSLKANDRWATCPACGHRSQVDEAGFEAAVAFGEQELLKLQVEAGETFKSLFKGGKK